MKEISEDKGRVRPVVEGDFQCDDNGNSTRFYEILSIVGQVNDDGTKISYISKTDVPIGIPLTDTTYWYPFQVIAVPKGDKGDKGDKGEDGKSAYDLYIEHGGTITPVEAWLESLQGKAGKDGKDGKDGTTPIIKISDNGMDILISSDNGETWYVLVPDFTKLRILGFVDSISQLPKSANVGDIYGVWNAEAQEGAGAYELYINTVKDWLLDATITKIYSYDVELPSVAQDGSVAIVPIKLILDKEKVDAYKVYKYNSISRGWILILNTAEIYNSKDDIVNYGDNLYALVQGSGLVTETKLKEETIVSKNDYCRISNMTDEDLLLIITQDSKRIFHSIGTGTYMIPNNCGVFLVKDHDLTGVVIAESMSDPNPKHLSSLEYMPEGIYSYYILTENSAGDIYITPESKLEPEGEVVEGLTIETKITTLLSFKQTYELYRRDVGWVFFGTNASITYHLVQNIQEGLEDNILSGKAVKDAINVISKGTNITLTANPSIVYKGVDTVIAITSQMNKSTPTNIKILDGVTILANGSNNPLVYTSPSPGFALNTDKTFTTEGIVNNVIFGDDTVIQARYPIYYGFAANAAALAIDANRYPPTTTAAHTYTKTNTVDNQHFYILVPSDISGVSVFTMGGAPFVMNTERTETVNGISYKVYESAYAYNVNVTLKVSAS